MNNQIILENGSEKNEFKNNFILRFNLKDNFFENEKRQHMLNLLFKYNKNRENIELRHITGFMNLYRDEVIFLYKENSIKKILSLFNFGEDFDNKILSSLQNEENNKIKLNEEKEKQKIIFLKEQEERREKEINELREKYLALFEELFENNDLDYQKLGDFLVKNKYEMVRCFDFPLTIKGVCSYFKVSKELKEKILLEQKLEKEQIKQQKEKEKQEKIEAEKKRLNYLSTLGLSEEIFITQSTLKNIFTDKILAEYFPTPFSEAPNPNLSKSYQKAHGLTMKLYRMADVIELVKKGVKPRIKNELKNEYKKMLSAFILDLELEKKSTNKKIISKI